MSKINLYANAPSPKLSDKLVGTSVGNIPKNATYNFTLQQLLDLFVPNIPSNNLQGVLDNGNTATQTINLTGTINTVSLNATGSTLLKNTYLNGPVRISGSLSDVNNSVGTSGQVLSTTGVSTRWISLPTYVAPTATAPINYNSVTGNISILQSSTLSDGYLSSTNWNTFNQKQSAISLTTDGSSGASTFLLNVLNVPNYTLSGLGGVPTSRTLTINGVTYDLNANRSWTIAMGVSSVVATSPIFSSGGLNPNISIQKSGPTQNGYLGSSDWIIFNSKQNAGNYITSLTGEATATGPGSATVTLGNSAVIGKVLTGLSTSTGGSIVATDSILTAFGKVQNQITGLVGGVTYQGVWDAATNDPTLTSSVGTQGYYYVVNVAGSTNLNGITDWKVGDWAIFNGTVWNKVDNTDSVSSVNGQTGAVSLTTDDISEGTTNLYYLDSRARAALSFAAGSGAYDNISGVITIPTNTSQLTNGAAFITLGSLTASSPLSYNNTTGAFSISQASASVNGYLSSTDWTTFNSKQNTITPAALTKTDDTNVTLTLGGSPTTSLLAATSITVGWTGTLADSRITSATTWNAKQAALSGSGIVKSTAGTISYISGTSSQFVKGDGSLDSTTYGTGTVTSVGLSMPSAFSVGSSPVTGSGTITVTGSGATTQYIDGTGALQTFPTIITEAQNLITDVYNETGATLTKGTVVYINGGHGNLPTITKALATSDATSAQTYGVVQLDITNNNNGHVVVIGTLSDLNTFAYAPGTQLYLSSTTAGQWTDVKQYAPAHLVYVGIVVRQHPTQGIVEVRIQNGFEMDELHNVSAQSPSNNSILQYVSSTALWTAVAGSTTNISEGTNLYYTDARARSAVSLTTTGSSGASTYSSSTGVLNVPTYTLSGLGGQPLSTNLTSLSGLSYTSASFVKMTAAGTFTLDTTAYGTGTVTSVAALTLGTTGTDVSSSVATGTTTPVITLNLPTSSITNRGLLSSTDWSTFNNKQNSISGSGIVKSTSGTISYISGTSSQFVKGDGSLDSTTYATLASFTASSPLSYSFFTGAFSISQASNIANGYLTSTDWNTFNNKGSGTVTSVAALTIGTTGSNITSTVANGSSTPVITLQVPDASMTSRGALTSTDWSTFNNKQAYLSGSGIVKSTSGTISYISGTSSQFVKGDGSLDSSVYITSSGTANIAGGSLGAIPYQSAVNATTVLAATSTANKILLSGASAAPTWSIPTFPNASATTRKIIVSDGTNWVASTETYAVPGTSGNVLTSDGTNWISSPASGGGSTFTVSIISTNTAAVKNYIYVLTASLTLTLPAAPSVGDTIKISNQSGVLTCVIARNSLNIMGLAQDLTVDKLNMGMELVYVNSTYGWVII